MSRGEQELFYSLSLSLMKKINGDNLWRKKDKGERETKQEQAYLEDSLFLFCMKNLA